jgi:hypothetical protein
MICSAADCAAHLPPVFPGEVRHHNVSKIRLKNQNFHQFREQYLSSRAAASSDDFPAGVGPGRAKLGWRNGAGTGKLGMFSFCLPVDISSVTGRCQHCWSHAKAQRRKVRTEGSLFQRFTLAPLREVKSWNRKTLESGQSGMLSYWLPVSLTRFHHPRAKLGGETARGRADWECFRSACQCP